MGKKQIVVKGELFQHLFSPLPEHEYIVLRVGGPDLPAGTRIHEFALLNNGCGRITYESAEWSELIVGPKTPTGGVPLIDGVRNLTLARIQLPPECDLHAWLGIPSRLEAELEGARKEAEELRTALALKNEECNKLRARVHVGEHTGIPG